MFESQNLFAGKHLARVELFALCLALMLPVLGQKAQGQSPTGIEIEAVAQQACECLDQITEQTTASLREEMNQCLEEALSQPVSQLSRKELKDPQIRREWSTALAQYLTQRCEAFEILTIQLSQTPEVNQDQGIWTELRGHDLAHLILKKEGTEKTYLCISPFPDAEKFLNNWKQYRAKEIIVHWKPIHYYDFQKKSYVWGREIKKIEILN